MTRIDCTPNLKSAALLPALALILAGCSGPAPASAHASAPAPADTAASDTAASDTAASTNPAPHQAPPADPAAPTPAAAPAAAPSDSFLAYDAASNTVTFQLIAGPFDFNGFTSGGATLSVPPGSNNVIVFEQKDGTPHSAEVASGTGPVPNSGGEPAIPRAYTNSLTQGLPQGAVDTMKFTAPDTGSYRLICGVPGHALSGMWIWFKVDPSAKTPSFGPTKQS
jgi:plastocyanin